MHREHELTRVKSEEDQRRTRSELEEELPTTPSETDSDDRHSTNDVVLVNFQPGEPANPHNWSKVSSHLEPAHHLSARGVAEPG